MAGGDVQTQTLAAQENTDHYLRLRDTGHLDFVDKAQKCEEYVQGYPNKQWEADVLARLQAEGRPAMSINKIFPGMAATMGEQLQNQVDVAFRPTASGNEETAAALDVAWLHVANSNMLDWRRAEVFDDGVITGRGFYDLRMTFSDNLRGDLQIRKLNNRNALIDADAESYDPDDWNECIVTKWYTPDQIAATYDTAKAKELEFRASSDMEHGYDFMDWPKTRFGQKRGFSYGTVVNERHRKKFVRVIERQHKELRWKEHFVDAVSGETRVIPSTWDRERIGKVLANVPNLNVLRLQSFVHRWTVSAFDVLLFDKDSPYKHFTIVPYFPMLVGGVPIGIVENLINPQEVLNKTASQELHVINTTANSGWQVKRGGLQNMTIQELEQRGSQTGLVLEVDEIGSAEKIQPNNVPTGLDRVSHNARNDIFEISLANRSQLGVDREDVSGKAIERKQLRGSINMSKFLANLVRTEHMLARNAVDLIQAFWTEERMLQVTRKNRGRDEPVEMTLNQLTPEGVVVNDVTLGEYQVITSTVSLREQQEDSEFDQAMAMREQGVDIPDEEVVAVSRMRNKKEILEGMKATQEQRAQDMETDRRLKSAEADEAEASVQATKTKALEGVARAKKAGQEEQLMMLEKQTELAKAATSMQLARNDQERLELEREELRIKREEMRRNDRLKRAELRQNASANQGAGNGG